MSKTRAVIALATSIALTPVALAPLAAMAQSSAAPVMDTSGMVVGLRRKPPETKAEHCAKEVKAKGLRGKPAKKFRAACEKNLR